MGPSLCSVQGHLREERRTKLLRARGVKKGAQKEIAGLPCLLRSLDQSASSSPKEAGSKEAVGECLLPPLSAKKTPSAVS